MRKSTTCLFILAVAIVIAALMSVGIAVSAQNANSSTTMSNNNMAKPKPRRGRRGRAPKAAAESTPTTAADTTMAMPAAPKRTGRCDPNQQEQTDLSGTYTGKLKHGNAPVADATLTVTGNNFTGTMGSQTVSGRIIAVTTCGYTAVTIMHEGQPRAMSLRAKRMGTNGLMLTSVPGEPEQIMFTTGGGMMRPRKHRMTKKPVAPPPPTKTTP